MAAFVMAYSFTEQCADDDSNRDNDAAATAPAMVPMADILNHISNNNAHLEFGTETMTMVATQDICKVIYRLLYVWHILTGTSIIVHVVVWALSIFPGTVETFAVTLRILADTAGFIAGTCDRPWRSFTNFGDL